jgi:hypothetical protein
MSEGNGKPVGVEYGSGAPVYVITITCGEGGEAINVEGLNVPPWIALGMLKYMEILVRRRELENTMAAMAAQTPRIALPGGPL